MGDLKKLNGFFRFSFALSLAFAPSLSSSGKIFDFNSTLPLISIQFLLLAAFLDRSWFSPVGSLLDSRETYLHARLSSIRSGGNKLSALQSEAQAVLSVARAQALVSLTESTATTTQLIETQISSEKALQSTHLLDIQRLLELERSSLQVYIDRQVHLLTQFILTRLFPASYLL